MAFQPRVPVRALCLSLALMLALPAPSLHAQARLPALGEAASADFDINDERRLGEQIMGEIRRDPAYLDDPVLLDYVQSLWTPLVDAARRQGHIGPDTATSFAFESFLVRDRTVNAFALPGGHVGVHLGLIAMTEHADELASVLAHELTHVTQRHIARRIGDQQRVGMVGLAAMILGVLAAARANSTDMAQAAVMGGQAAMIQGQLNYSRDMEREADRIGFGLLGEAGFSPRGMAGMFEKLEFANRLNDSGAYPYLRSHPLTSERIGEARGRVGEAAPPMADAPLHAIMRARARVLMDTSATALQRLQAAPEASGQDLPALVQQALVALQLRDTAAAERAVAAASRRAGADGVDPAVRRAVFRLAAEVHLSHGQAAAARQALAEAGAGEGRPGLFLSAQAALLAQRQQGPDAAAALRRSAESLQVWTADHPEDVSAWTLLGQTAQAAGLPLRAQRAQAEAQAVVGDLPGAVDRLRAAQRSAAGGPGAEQIELQVIDARLRVLAQRLRERQEAERQRR